MAKEGAARKHLIARSGKLVRNANVNFSSSRPTAITCPIDKQDHFNDDILAIVNCDPGMFVCFCGAQCACVSVNAFVSCVARPIGWLGGSHRLQLNCKIYSVNTKWISVEIRDAFRKNGIKWKKFPSSGPCMYPYSILLAEIFVSLLNLSAVADSFSGNSFQKPSDSVQKYLLLLRIGNIEKMRKWCTSTIFLLKLQMKTQRVFRCASIS